MTYLQLVGKHPKYLAYAALHYFFSSPGQTFLISVSVPFILSDLSLTSLEFSNSYALATMISAFTLPFIGGFADRTRLSILSILCGLGLMVACAVMYTAHSLIFLTLGLFLLRFFGQGYMVLIGSTAVAKFFTQNRGKALSLAGIGLALAEMLMPMIIVGIIAITSSWNDSWAIIGASIVLIFIPASFFLVRHHPGGSEDDEQPVKREETAETYRRRSVLKDLKFYLILPGYLFLPLFITGIFIHQNLLAAARGWTMEWMALTFIGFGISKVVTSFLGGTLIDRFSAKQVFIFYLIPLALGLALLLIGRHQLIAMAYMVLLGMTAGLGALTGKAMWAELYGVKNFASITSMVTTMLVLSTAIGPIILGWALEKSYMMTMVGSILTIVFFTFLSFLGLSHKSFFKKMRLS